MFGKPMLYFVEQLYENYFLEGKCNLKIDFQIIIIYLFLMNKLIQYTKNTT